MAIMWPRRLPQEILQNPLRAAECRVFEALDTTLDASWSVYYSRPWLGLSQTGEEIDGEADFVVAHPQHGFLAIEVKGGEIRYDPAIEKWTSTDRGRITHRIKNPVAQARTCKYRILEQLEQSPYWKPRRICIRHGVIFVDALVPDRAHGPDRPRFIFADRSEFKSDLAGWIQKRFLNHAPDDKIFKTEPLGEDGVRALNKLLADPFHMRVPIGHLMDDDDAEIGHLTQRQFAILSALRDLPRVAVRGAAGTGKTVLAVEMARRTADTGARTLLTCYNKALAKRLALTVGTVVDLRNFHSLCTDAAGAAGLTTPRGIHSRDLYENVLPNFLADAAEQLPDLRYDMIVVDEGQDFRGHWWPALESVLKPGGRLVVFYDSNQALYGEAASLPRDLSALPIPLDRNLRNTDPIHALAMCHYQGEAVLPSGVPGLPVDMQGLSDMSKCRQRVREVVTRLSVVEAVAPDDVTVLCDNEAVCAAIAPGGLIGDLPIARCDDPRPGAVVVDTVRRFKGLESRVVVLLATDALFAERELAYVAISRARTHLICIGSEAALSRVKGEIFQRSSS
jgi:hypothetical protein